MQRAEPVPERLSHLVVRRQVAVSSARVAGAVRAAGAWLGPEVDGAPDGMHRHETDLRLRVGEQMALVTFRKAAYVDIGRVKALDDGYHVEIGWRAATFAPLFPVFSGSLAMHDDRISVSGWYAPPGGALGRLVDRGLLHVAARATARWLLGELERAATRP